MHLQYRREIDGLRAVAVMPVIFFHAGFEVFSGGFVGVDVFFVISDYLIASIIILKLKDGSFSLLNFFERRARRILPPLFVVMLTCLPFAWWWMTPHEMNHFCRSLVAVTVFSSNILFWRDAGYFGTAGELNPLLHTWSLAVEEQYYLLFPIFMLLAWRYGRRWIPSTLIVVAVASLALAQWGSTYKPTATFFLLPTRGWELLIGVLIAFSQTHGISWARFWTPKSSVSKDALSAIGLFLIAYAVFLFNESTPFPGFNALLPTCGTALVILFATPDTRTGRALGSKPLVGMGLVSYSAYLWHQPLFAFALIHDYRRPSILVFGILILASIVLAYFSWRFVETPFRNARRVSRRSLIGFALIFSLSFVGVGILGTMTDGYKDRFCLPKSIIDSFALTDMQSECFDKVGVGTRDDWYCDLGDAGKDFTFAVFGDSHSLAAFPAFDEAAKHANTRGIYAGTGGCPPLLGIHLFRGGRLENDCIQMNQRVYDFVKEHRIRKVFLIARWSYYTDGGYDGREFSRLGFGQPGDAADFKSASRAAFKDGLRTTVESFTNAGAHVYIFAQIPQQYCDPQKIYYRSNTSNSELLNGVIHQYSVSSEEHFKLQGYSIAVFDAFRQRDDVSIIALDEVFRDGDKYIFGNANVSYYLDDDHLSVAGSRLLIDKIGQFVHD